MSAIRPFAITAPRLIEHGHSPIPQRPREQRAFLEAWPQYAERTISEELLSRYCNSPLPYNVGIALGFGNVVTADRDTDDARVKEAVRPIFTAIYARGGVPVAKYGSKGLTTFFRWEGVAPFVNRSFSSPELRTFFELSGPGRSTTLPPSIHPKTGGPYVWTTKRTLLDTRPDELPVMTAADVAAIEAALAPFLPPPRPDPVISRPAVNPAELDERQRMRHERYAETILDRETASLAGMPAQSGRNWATYRLACRVGRYVHHGILDERQVVQPLLAANEANGLVRDTSRTAVLNTIESGLAKSANDSLPDLRASSRGGR